MEHLWPKTGYQLPTSPTSFGLEGHVNRVGALEGFQFPNCLTQSYDVRKPRWEAACRESPTPRPEPAPCGANEGNPVINHPQRGLQPECNSIGC